MKSNRLYKYIAAVLLFAFSFAFVVKAAKGEDIDMTVSGETPIVTGIDYRGTVTCNGTLMTSKTGKTITTAGGGTLRSDSVGTVYYTPADGATSGATDSFTCVYDIRNHEENVEYNYHITVFRYETSIVEEHGTVTLDDPYYTLRLDSNTRVVFPANSTSTCPAPETADTEKYFECLGCHDNICEFKLKDLDFIPEGTTGIWTIKYAGRGQLITDSDAVQKEVKLYLEGSMDKGAYAYGGAGTCSWPSGWTPPNESLHLIQNANPNNTKQHKFTGPTDSVALPASCERESSDSYPLPLKFVGWTLLKGADVDRMAINTCANFSPINGSISYEKGVEQHYGACYTMSGAMIYNSEVIIEDGNWKDTGLGYHISSVNNPTLPDATPRIISLNPSAEFIGYSNRNGDCSGSLIQPGAAAVDGAAYYACIKYDTNDGAEQDLNIKLNDKQDFIPSSSYVKGCTSENTEYVLADYSNGACVITGIKRTYQYRTPEDETDDYVIVKVLTSREGTQYTLRIHVLADEDMPTIDLDDYTLDSSSGAEIDDSMYGDRQDVITGTCGVYNLRPNMATRQESGIQVGYYSGTAGASSGQVPLRVHFYQGSSQCGDITESFIGICMDPGREEPATGGSNYVKERELDPKNNKFDRLISYIYTDTNFIKDVNNYKADQANTNLDYLVSATIAIRLGAILYQEDANNTGMGLDGYYLAYKAVAQNIQDATGGNIANVKTEHLSTGTVVFFDQYASKAATFLREGYTYEGGWGELKATATNTTTEWSDDKSTYTKTIEGTLSGLNLFTKAALNLNTNCTGAFAGKCKLYMKNLEKQDYDEYNSAINYFQNATYMDRNGNLYYKIVIGPVSVAAVAAAVKDYNQSGGAYGAGNSATGGGNGGGGSGGPFDAVLTTDYASPDAKGNVSKAISKNGVNIQSMILFKDSGSEAGSPATCPDGYTYNASDKLCHKNNPPYNPGQPGGEGDGSSGCQNPPCDSDPDTVPPQPGTTGGDWSIEVGAELEDDGEPIRLAWVHQYYTVSTLLPACDLSNEIFNYKNQGPKFDATLFKYAGCCSFVFDHSSEFYKTNCSETCIYNSVMPVCTYDAANTTGYDVTKIVEARNGDKDNYTCVIDLNSFERTENKKDPAGNNYAVDLFKGNKYCRVSCKEEWQFNFPTLKNYVGAHAVRAGQYFTVDDKNVFIGGTRTCVTTRIKHTQYRSDVNSTAPTSFNEFNKWQIEEALVKTWKAAEYTEKTPYKWCDGEMKANVDYQCIKDDGTSAGACGTGGTCDEGTCKNVGSGYHCDGTERECVDFDVDPTKHPEKYRMGIDGPKDYPENSTLDSMKDCDTYGAWCDEATSYYGYIKPEEILPYKLGEAMDTSTGAAGSCKFDHKPTEDEARELVELEKIGAMNPGGHQGAMQGANAQLSGYAGMIGACDYFQLMTKDSKSGSGAAIMSTFDPIITFEYDEKEYMKEIGSNNRLVKNKVLNEKCDTSAEKDANGCPELVESAARHSTYYKCEVDPQSYDCGNKVEGSYDADGVETTPLETSSITKIVCAAGGEGMAIVGATKESSGHMQHWSTNDGCFDVTFSYLVYNYIKRSISDSSYYKSEYTWYINKITDVKIYAKSLKNYAKLHPSSGADKIQFWSPFGTTQVENSVYPIMIKTPRNMYTYRYKLTQIGMYSDATVGRLMGGPTAIFSNNNRICFYEVVEEICLCCADNIDTHTNVGSIAANYVNDGTDSRKVNTAEALAIAGYDYKVSNFSYSTVGNDGRLGYLTSTVSLGDIMANRDKTEISSIWTPESIYTVSGVDQFTAQGAMLKAYIEDNANKVYDATPEYSYTLTPSAMSGIRKYNEAYGFQPNINTLKMYGSIRYQNSDTDNWLGKMYYNNAAVSQVHFSHYGSLFLEQNAAPYVTKEYKDAVLTNKEDVCFMIIEHSGSDQENNPDYKGKGTKLYKDIKDKDASTTADYKDCRWIDVVQQTTNHPEGSNVEPYSRLAFK